MVFALDAKMFTECVHILVCIISDNGVPNNKFLSHGNLVKVNPIWEYICRVFAPIFLIDILFRGPLLIFNMLVVNVQICHSM
jgi:hypothetical protein